MCEFPPPPARDQRVKIVVSPTGPEVAKLIAKLVNSGALRLNTRGQ